MTANEKTLATFETRLHQMILRFQELKKENGEFFVMLQNQEKTVTWKVPRVGCRNLSVMSISVLLSSAMNISN